VSVEPLARGRIAIRDVSVWLGEGPRRFNALQSVSVAVKPGELVCILGPSGCGKSTLLGAVAGLLPITSGELGVDGHPVVGPSAERGMVFQQHTLLPWLDTLRNVAFPLKMKGVPRAERDERARSLLDRVGLAGFERHYPAQLSGGMQQRVELARALINEPRVLLMDEPFGALDAQNRLDLQELLLDVWLGTKTTVLFVTHDVDEAVFLGDRVLVMTSRPGEIRAEIDILLPRPRTPEVLTSQAFLQLRRHCFDLVREQLQRSRTSDRPSSSN
jgi:NitT/TauT family transport system ATP-binding protein